VFCTQALKEDTIESLVTLKSEVERVENLVYYRSKKKGIMI